MTRPSQRREMAEKAVARHKVSIALAWSNAPVIVGAHDPGPLIRSRNGFWLAIPTPAAGKSTKG